MATSLRVVEKESMEDKTKALDAALGQIERAFGKGSIMRLGDEQAVDVATISPGSLGLDIALGSGGGAPAYGAERRPDPRADRPPRGPREDPAPVRPRRSHPRPQITP